MNAQAQRTVRDQTNNRRVVRLVRLVRYSHHSFPHYSLPLLNASCTGRVLDAIPSGTTNSTYNTSSTSSRGSTSSLSVEQLNHSWQVPQPACSNPSGPLATTASSHQPSSTNLRKVGTYSSSTGSKYTAAIRSKHELQPPGLSLPAANSTYQSH